jgi:hypothetical protein
MADRSSKPSDVPASAGKPVPGLRLAPQLQMMFLTFWASPQRSKILLLGLALVAVIGATAFGQVRLTLRKAGSLSYRGDCRAYGVASI